MGRLISSKCILFMYVILKLITVAEAARQEQWGCLSRVVGPSPLHQKAARAEAVSKEVGRNLLLTPSFPSPAGL